MLLDEIFSLFESLDLLLTEGFKDDMYRLYPEAQNDPAFNNAIKSFNSDQKIKNAIKKKISINGNIANSLKTTCPTAQDFVNFIDNLSKEISTKEQERQEYKEIKKGISNVNETDYWMIPCHTFEELRKAAFMYGGNLQRLSNKEIRNEYDIKAPESATHYETDKTPKEFLEFMKKENRFFMTPSWCIAGSEKGQEYFNDYELTTEKDEKPLCYIFISKKYPNVRFCITLIKDSKATGNNSYDDGKIKTPIINKFSLDEVRDPWQIGGEDVAEIGLEMMKLAFGPKIEKVIKNICSKTNSAKIIPASELKRGSAFFENNHNISDISCSFDNLLSAYKMFFKSSLKNIDCKFPLLEDSEGMFFKCSELTSVNADFPKLIYATWMFSACESLTEINTDLPKLKNATRMFFNCTKLKKFECKNISSLEEGYNMFRNCHLLEKFEYDLPHLEGGCRNVSGV